MKTKVTATAPIAATLPPRSRPRRATAAATPKPQIDRRTAILLAAEKLFALQGYHAVSIRDIAREAGVPLALVGYYYGAKHELFHAIFESWSSVITGRRSALQAALQAEPDAGQRLDAIIRTFVQPLVELHQNPEGKYYAMMATRDLALPTPEADRVHQEIFDPLAHDFIDALMGTGRRISRGRAAWCYQFMLGAVLHFLSDRRVERLSRGENQPGDPKALAELLSFLGAGCRALLQPGPAGKAAPRRQAAG